jgi:hypothetical protein
MDEQVNEDAIRAYLMSQKWKKQSVGVMAVMEEKLDLSAEDMKKLENCYMRAQRRWIM